MITLTCIEDAVQVLQVAVLIFEPHGWQIFESFNED